MAKFVTNVSDKSKKKAKRLLLFGGLGFHYFYVGKIGVGFVRLLIGAFLWMEIIFGIVEHEFFIAITCAALLVIINLFDFFKLCLGKFQDNIGNYIRQ